MFAFIFLVIPFVKSEVSTIYYPQNQTADLKLPCWNNNTYCSSGAKCNITITYGNDSLLINNLGMTNSNGIFNYTLTPAQTSTKGIYKEYVICSDGMNNGYSAVQFYITGNGLPPGNNGLMIFIYILFVLSILGLISMFFLILAKLVTVTVNIYDVLLSWLSILIMLITVNLSERFLLSITVETLARQFITICTWTNVVFPAIAFVISVMLNTLQKKRPLKPGELLNG